MKKNLEKLMSNEDDFIRVKKFFMNHKLIGIVLYLANEKQDIMELKRVVDIFEVLGENMLFEVDLFFITNLAKGLNAIITENKKYFSLSIFFTNLIQAHEIYFPEEEASQYIPTESNIFDQNYNNLENDITNKVQQGLLKIYMMIQKDWLEIFKKISLLKVYILQEEKQRKKYHQ